MDEYTKNKLKHFISEGIPENLPPLQPEKPQNADIPFVSSGSMNNVIIGYHSIIINNTIGILIFFATVVCAVAFFY